VDRETEEIKQQISSYEDGKLLYIAKTYPSRYRQVTINLAIEELLRRTASPDSQMEESPVLHLDTQCRPQDDEDVPLAPQSRSIWSWITGFILISNLARYLVEYLSDKVPDIHTLPFSTIPLAILSGLLILPLGIVLYAIRERSFMLYAHLEILFGILWGIYSIGDKNHWGAIGDSSAFTISTWTALVASLYIVVRGLDNRKKAMTRASEAREREIEMRWEIENSRHQCEMKSIAETLKEHKERSEQARLQDQFVEYLKTAELS
jgi:hypothetical protein